MRISGTHGSFRRELRGPRDLQKRLSTAWQEMMFRALIGLLDVPKELEVGGGGARNSFDGGMGLGPRERVRIALRCRFWRSRKKKSFSGVGIGRLIIPFLSTKHILLIRPRCNSSCSIRESG